VKIAFLYTVSSEIQVAQHLWRTKGALAVSTMLPGKQRWLQRVLVGQETALRAARGFEEGTAQLKLAQSRDCSACYQLS